jgi:RNA polymerase sigma-70 factor (sigma-E family)
MIARRDSEFTDYVSARLPSLRRLAFVLCQDWHAADDLVQAALTKTYLHWGRAAGAENTDAYVHATLVREFVRERRTAWARRVSPTDHLPEARVPLPDRDGLLDLQDAVAGLPPRQRAVLVLRFYCDMNVEHSAELLGCTPGTIKSQTSKALGSLRRALRTHPDGDATHDGAGEVTNHA